MKRTHIITGLLVVLAVGVLLFLYVSESTKRDAENTQALPFLNSEFVTVTDLPSAPVLEDKDFSCSATSDRQYEVTKETEIGGKKFCATLVAEGAAGSVYGTYTYTTEEKGKTLSYTFTVKEVQCLNYPEDKAKECQGVQDAFDPEEIVMWLINNRNE